MSSKIIVKKPTASATTVVPKASSIVVSAKKVAAPQKVVVKAPAKVVAPVKKVMVPAKNIAYDIMGRQVLEEVEEDAPMTAQDIYERITDLLGELVGLTGGRGKIKLTKTGKIRKPRGPRENSEKQAAWMEFVKQVRAEQGVDENGNFLISHKDAMKLAKELRAEAGSEGAEEEEAEPAPAPKKVVVTTKKPSPAAAAPLKRSPQQIREELAAKKAAEEAVTAEQEAEVEVEEFEHNGKTYLKNGDNLCWLVDADGNQTWAGAYLPDEDRIDETVEEPMA